jgi:Molybdopterin-binding domain of aldehyde dehydrogenase
LGADATDRYRRFFLIAARRAEATSAALGPAMGRFNNLAMFDLPRLQLHRAGFSRPSAEPSRFRRFLWRYGSDIRRGRERYRFLAQLALPTRFPTLDGPDLWSGWNVVSVLARHLGRAVRWTGDRLEDLASTSHGFDEIVAAELALDKDGHILALAAEVIGDIGAYSIYPWTAALEPVQVVSFMPGPYCVPTYRGHVRAVATCKAVCHRSGPRHTVPTCLDHGSEAQVGTIS